jgi:hypothetical protein
MVVVVVGEATSRAQIGPETAMDTSKRPQRVQASASSESGTNWALIGGIVAGVGVLAAAVYFLTSSSKDEGASKATSKAVSQKHHGSLRLLAGGGKE